MKIIAVCIVIIAVSVMVTGCSHAPQDSIGNAVKDSSQRIERLGNTPRNMTALEKHSQERVQPAIDACIGKAENDPCKIETPFGARNSTCRRQNDTLLCSGLLGSRPRGGR